MTFSEPAQTKAWRNPRILVAGALVLIAAIAASPIEALRSELGAADGALADGVSVFDKETPAVTNLNRGLLGALRQAATHAAHDGVEIVVNSGWRSPEYQEQLLHEAVSKYGTKKEAARWVAPAITSAHVSGDAVDIGRSGARAWLSRHGAKYGLCQIYRNEPWHYELRLAAIQRGCPPRYADPAHDPRMQQRRQSPRTGRRHE